MIPYTRFSSRKLGFAAFCTGVLMLTNSGGATLTTTFASNNGQSGNMFDILTNSDSISLNGLGVNIPAFVNSGTYEIYYRIGSHVGVENTASAWTLLDTFTGVSSAGDNTATFLDTTDLIIPANTRVAIYSTSTTPNSLGLRYTNGTGVGDVASSNADVTIFQGTGNSYAFGTTFQPRIWNGTIDYEVIPAAVPEPARAGLLLLGFLAASTARKRKISR